ncbi:MAG: SMC-Scp complex subunit ScpB [Spirochaetes bacterium]|nr:SMC-Scp complex subunit ScpB [Spirochaetota bacterium]
MEEKNINTTELKGLVEAILFVHSEPITYGKLSEMVQNDTSHIKQVIKELAIDYQNRNAGIKIMEMAGGVRLGTNEAYGEKLKSLFQAKKKQKFSKASLETLAIIAYKQPITRSEIETIRGVSIDNGLRDLMERDLIKITGRKDSPGAPALYGTTKKFLQYFGLKSIKELPTLKEIKELNFD